MPQEAMRVAVAQCMHARRSQIESSVRASAPLSLAAHDWHGLLRPTASAAQSGYNRESAVLKLTEKISSDGSAFSFTNTF
jgi:hypothetical protein